MVCLNIIYSVMGPLICKYKLFCQEISGESLVLIIVVYFEVLHYLYVLLVHI